MVAKDKIDVLFHDSLIRFRKQTIIGNCPRKTIFIRTNFSQKQCRKSAQLKYFKKMETMQDNFFGKNKF